jgi:hypothetical protein
LPKADLHVHLDGSLRIATIIDLAKSLPPAALPPLPSHPTLAVADWTPAILEQVQCYHLMQPPLCSLLFALCSALLSAI